MKACMLAYSHYENDNRVRRYADALFQKGWQIDAIGLKKQGERPYDIIEGVHLFRIQRREKNEKGKIGYLLRLLRFFVLSSLQILKRSLSEKYDLIHVHSVPDFEVFATLIPKLLGTKIILDIHDPVPDFFAAKFGDSNKNKLFIHALKIIERASTLYADHVITVTDYWRDVIRSRSRLSEQKISVIVNLPDITIFDINKYPRKKNVTKNFTLLYPGTINKHCGLDIVIQAVKIVKDEIDSFRFDIYGIGSEYDAIVQMVKNLHLEDTVFFHEIVPWEKVPLIMREADAGIALLAGKSTYSQQALNVKLFEFLALGVPVIATRTKSTSYYLDDSVVMFSNINDSKDVARCIKELYKDHTRRNTLSQNGVAYIKKNNWQTQKDTFIKIVDNLVILKRKTTTCQ